jgi:hypothetical protein
VNRIVSAPCGAAVKAGGGGSVALGSITGIGNSGSILTCEGAGFFAFSSAATNGRTSAMGACTSPCSLFTQPTEFSFS